MAQFLISLLLFIVVLALFWAVLHWVRYKKGDRACTCGKGACLTDTSRSEEKKHSHDKGECNASECECDE